MFIETLKCFKDERGNLYPINLKELPFKPKRAFIVDDVPKGVERGGHAHYETEQYLMCVKGSIKVLTSDGHSSLIVDLEPGKGFHIPNRVWDSQIFEEEGSVLLVFASTEYDKRDYIFSWEEFLKIINENSNIHSTDS